MDRLLQEQNLQKTTDEVIYDISSGDYLSAAFNRIPSNANINKGRCGIGGTSMELNDSRHSIIIVPNVAIILDKKRFYKDLLCIHGDISIAEITHQLEAFFKHNSEGHLKAMSTPDSFHKLVVASTKMGFDIFNECFLLFDESHSIVTEGTYRQNITRPFDYFFKFKHKSIMSATPYEFTDPRFSSLSRFKINTEHLNNRIRVVFSDSTLATLKFMTQRVREQENVNLHIFYNSIRSIEQFLHSIGNQGDDVNIFCANNDENKAKLDEFADLVKNMDDYDDLPINKINLYTTKYYEGWDLKDKHAVMVIVSDVSVEHTCIGITNKAVQAIGRLRNKALDVYHITNTFDSEELLSEEQIKASCWNDVQRKIDYYNDTIELFAFRDQTNLDIIDNAKGLIEGFSIVDQNTLKALIDHNKFDAIVNNRIALSQYTNKETVVDAWEEANFKVESVLSHLLMTKKDKLHLLNKRNGAAKKNKLIFEKLRDLDLENQNHKDRSKKGNLLFNFDVEGELNKLKNTYPNLFKYYKVLGFDKAKELRFNIKRLEQGYLHATASDTEVSKEVTASVYLYFKQGDFYPSTHVKEQISNIEKSFGINRTVTGAAIKKYFIAKETTKRIDGISTKGYQLGIKRV